MFLADFNFSISHLKKTPNCPFKYFKSSDIIVVETKSLSKFYYLSLFLFFVKKDKMVTDKNSNLIGFSYTIVIITVCIAVYLFRHIQGYSYIQGH